jgi:hypothetical protein
MNTDQIWAKTRRRVPTDDPDKTKARECTRRLVAAKQQPGAGLQQGSGNAEQGAEGVA